MANKYDQLGFVSLDEIQNVFTTKLDEIEKKIFPSCPSTERRSDQVFIMTALDGIRQELMKRAKSNLEHYLENNPQVKQEKRQTRAEEAETRNREAHDKRVSMGRLNYNRAYGGG